VGQVGDEFLQDSADILVIKVFLDSQRACLCEFRFSEFLRDHLMDSIDAIHHNRLGLGLPLVIVAISYQDGPFLFSVSQEFAFVERALEQGPVKMKGENEYLGIIVALLDLLVDQETVVCVVDLRQEEEIGGPTALETDDMRIPEILGILLVVDLRVATLVLNPRTQDIHLIQDIFLRLILCDVVNFFTTERCLRKTGGIHKLLFLLLRQYPLYQIYNITDPI